MGIFCCKSNKTSVESHRSETSVIVNSKRKADILLEPQTTGRAPTAQVAIKTTEGEASNSHQVGLVTGKFFIGLYDYESRQRNDISFKKGNRLELLDDSDNEWWKVRHIDTEKIGYIPRNFVAPEQSLELYDWYFGNISRKECQALLNQDLPAGTFIVRNSDHCPGGFALSIRDYNTECGYHTKHYKIRCLDRGGYYISRLKFETLPELIAAYTRDANGLSHILTTPCPRVQPTTWDLSPYTKDEWEIPRSELELIRLLGSGNFGEVWYGKWNRVSEVAVKRIKPGVRISSSVFLKEAVIMKKFRHPNLVALYAVCSTEEPVYIVTEYMNKGSLIDFLASETGKSLNFQDLLFIGAQVSNGMKYLEQEQLIHRDLAARNVVMRDNCIAKICDFGLARMIEEDVYEAASDTRFPVKWTAPEAALHREFSIKSDVWSFGVLLMELFTYGKPPYPEMRNREVLAKITQGYRMPNPESNPLPPSLYNLILLCWAEVPETRPTFEYLSSFLGDFNVASEPNYMVVVQ